LKLLAVELHCGDLTNVSHRETVRKILAYLYGQDLGELECDQDAASAFTLQNADDHSGTRTMRKNKVLQSAIVPFVCLDGHNVGYDAHTCVRARRIQIR